MGKEVLYVPDIAEILGTTEAGVRNHLVRKTDGTLPPGFKRGHRWAWWRRDVDRWLEERSQVKRGRGRPRKSAELVG